MQKLFPKTSTRFLPQEIGGFLLLLFLALLVFFPLMQTGYTTSDDVDLAIASINELLLVSQKAGRLNWVWSIPYTFFGEGLGNFSISWLPRFFQALFFISSLFFFGKRFLGAGPALLGCLVFLVSWTNDWQHNAITSYPIVFISGFCMFLISAERFWDFLETKNRNSFFVHLIAYFICLVSETFLVLSSVFFILNLVCLRLNHQKHSTFFSLPRNAHFIISLVFSFIYLGFQTETGHHHTVSLDWHRFFVSFATFTFFGFSEFFPPELLHTPLRFTWIDWATTARVLGLGLILVLIYKIFALEPSHHPSTFRRDRGTVMHLAWFFYFALLINLPVSLTSVYQSWVVDHKTTQYVWSVPSHAILCLVVGSVFHELYFFFKSLNRILFGLFVGFLGLLIFYGFLHNSAVNGRVFGEQRLSHWRWVVVDQIFGSSPEKGVFEEDAILVSSDLFSCKWIVCIRSDDYWSKYVKTRFSKTVAIVPELGKGRPLSVSKTPVYELSLYSGSKSTLSRRTVDSVKEIWALPIPTP